VPAPKPAKPGATPADLIPLPDPGPLPEDELLRGQPGSRLKPAPEGALIPNSQSAMRPGERPKNRSTLKPPTTSGELEGRIRYREARTKVASDPKVQALWEESRQARTDFEKRDALRRYYKTLYARILTMDKALAPIVEERQRTSLRRLDQTRIAPTDAQEELHRTHPDY
jgi:hypothetical protein